MEPKKAHKLITGRGATAIYLALNANCKNREVIAPSNICYAAILPIYYSGNRPHFVDVEYPSGNMSYESVASAINESTGAIIYPYMYGNISEDIIAIQQLCHEKNVLLIEDCASAMGAQINGIPVGEFGDYSIFSTGHAKNVDLNNGGILYTDLPIDKIENDFQNLPAFNGKIADEQSNFSKQYGTLRRSDHPEMVRELFENREALKEQFLYRITDDGLLHQIDDCFLILANESGVVEKKYDLFINNLPADLIYSYNEGSFPWRFSILVGDSAARKGIIEKLLSEKLFVSDWYPCIASAFGDDAVYPNAQRMEREILNFSLRESDEDILRSCAIISTVLQGKKDEEN